MSTVEWMTIKLQTFNLCRFIIDIAQPPFGHALNVRCMMMMMINASGGHTALPSSAAAVLVTWTEEEEKEANDCEVDDSPPEVSGAVETCPHRRNSNNSSPAEHGTRAISICTDSSA